jgi:hypothetical protein
VTKRRRRRAGQSDIPKDESLPGSLPLRKERVVEGELTTAIRLFFHDGDPVAVHVLASAAAAVLHDVGSANGRVTWRATMLGAIREEYQDAMADGLDAAFEFMKHGARDHDKEFKGFDPSINQLLLFVSSIDFWRVFERSTVELGVMIAFMLSERPAFLRPEGVESYSALADAVRGLAESPIIDKAAARRVLAIHDDLAAKGLID